MTETNKPTGQKKIKLSKFMAEAERELKADPPRLAKAEILDSLGRYMDKGYSAENARELIEELVDLMSIDDDHNNWMV